MIAERAERYSPSRNADQAAWMSDGDDDSDNGNQLAVAATSVSASSADRAGTTSHPGRGCRFLGAETLVDCCRAVRSGRRAGAPGVRCDRLVTRSSAPAFSITPANSAYETPSWPRQ